MAHVASGSDEHCVGTAATSKAPAEALRKRRRTERSRVGAAYPRKRAVAACRLCRARKIKCNNARPSCGGCMSSGSTCVYEDSQDHSAFDPASILILDRLDRVLERLDQGSTLSTIPPETTVTPNTDAGCHPLTDASSGPHDNVESYDKLCIPSSQTTPDAILSWPVFQQQWSTNLTTDPVFEVELFEEDSDTRHFRSNASFPAGGINEEVIPELIQKFLRYVHVKNPVVNAESIVLSARSVSEDGLKWDANSCLVLLACALGCVAKPFQDQNLQPQCTSLERDGQCLQHGEVYYNCARRRLGLLKAGILGTQCHFLAGVYLMYTIRPLSAWSHFRSASTAYRLHLDLQARRQARYGTAHVPPKQRSLEQSLYWSCYKSECELRMELNLPDSCLADVRYPDLHPLPPCPDASSQIAGGLRDGNEMSSSKTLDVQQQENSWFYYLTEITLRRIWNSVLNTLYVKDYKEWTDEQVPYMARAAKEFEQQLQEWYTGLPPPLQYETSKLPSNELPWLARARELEIRIQIYQPFLYYAVHQHRNSSFNTTVLPLAEKALYCSFAVIETFPSRHRHHGSWYAIRFTISASFLILAALSIEILPMREDWHHLMCASVGRLEYWRTEAPGVAEALEAIKSFL